MGSQAIVLQLTLALVVPALARADGGVKITPLGSHAGEFCRNDRALVFEDPTGLRVLYDPGRTINGGTDARLGDIHVVILSHAHVDHIGDVKPDTTNPGTCAAPGTVSAGPNSNLASIVAAKNSAFFAGGELQDWVGRKVQNVRGGTATPACPGVGLTNEMTVPQSAPCTASLRPGGSRTVRLAGAPAGVKFITVPAFHSNGIPTALVDDPGLAPGIAGYGGSETGFVVKFTNGLTVYLTGDTGLYGDMRTIIRNYYHPHLMVVNISDTATLGPDEGAFAVSRLVKPQTVIPSHINEAATSSGAPSGERMQRFLDQISGSGVSVVLPLSGVTREFDGSGNCLNCQ
jgi:L-ascorbate metabolism protein UlaG (beta-lactamase superfamily)